MPRARLTPGAAPGDPVASRRILDAGRMPPRRREAERVGANRKGINAVEQKEDKELVQVLMTRAKLNQFHQEKLSRDALYNAHAAQKQVARANMLSAKTLLKAVGVEEAVKLTEETSYEFNYMMGRKRAEALGNPKDLDSMLYAYIGELLDAIPWVPNAEFIERSEKKIVWGNTKCMYADYINEWRTEVPEFLTDDVYKVMCARCSHDHGWANGFNPDIEFKRVQFKLDGDKGCFFEMTAP